MQRNIREIEDRDRELAEKVASATLEQIRLKFDADMEILKQRVPTKEKEAHEAALDIKYLQQRQKMLVPNYYDQSMPEVYCIPFFGHLAAFFQTCGQDTCGNPFSGVKPFGSPITHPSHWMRFAHHALFSGPDRTSQRPGWRSIATSYFSHQMAQ